MYVYNIEEVRFFTSKHPLKVNLERSSVALFLEKRSHKRIERQRVEGYYQRKIGGRVGKGHENGVER